jgi:hypothetical protein
MRFLFAILVLLTLCFQSRANSPYYPIGTKKCPKHGGKLETITTFARHGRDDEHDSPYCTSSEILLCKKCQKALAKNTTPKRGKEEKNITPLPKACPVHGTTLEQHAAYGLNSDGSCDLIYPAKHCWKCDKSYP